MEYRDASGHHHHDSDADPGLPGRYLVEGYAVETRSPEEILNSYNAAETLGDWLRDETALYLSQHDPGSEDINERVEDLFAALSARIGHLRDTQRDPDALLGFELRVFDDTGGQHSVAVFDELPHPVEMLCLVAEYAFPGDTVIATHHYPGMAGRVEATWPFGVETALVMTSPDPASHIVGLDPDSQGGPNIQDGPYGQDGPDSTGSVGVDGGWDVTAAGALPASSVSLVAFGAALGAALVAAGVALGAAISPRR